MVKRNKLLPVLAFCLALGACYNKYEQEMIVVSKTPRGDLVGEKKPSGEPYEQGWYDVGLSRNGQEPIEYILFVPKGYYDSAIMEPEIGEKGTVHVPVQKPSLGSPKRRLPRPNAKKPPIVYTGRVFWIKQE